MITELNGFSKLQSSDLPKLTGEAGRDKEGVTGRLKDLDLLRDVRCELLKKKYKINPVIFKFHVNF